jgi:hypothetical protein
MLSSTLFLALMAFQAGPEPSPLLLPLAAPDSTWTYRAETDAVMSRAGFEVTHAANDGYHFSIAGFGRISWPFGSLSDDEIYLVGNLILIPDHLQYSEVFEAGWGYGLEASFMFQRFGATGPGHRGPGPHSAGLNAGVYLSLQTDTYEGDRESEGNASIDPDDLTMVAAFIGMKVSTVMGDGMYGDAHIGIGVVRYDQVDADVSIFGGPGEKQEFLEESQEFAFESRYRFSAKLGPVALFGGLGLRIMGSPDEGDSNLGSGIDAHTFWAFDVDFGVMLGF